MVGAAVMELQYFKGNPIFPFEGKSRQVKLVWELKLKKGEAVVPHGHSEGDEIYIVLGGIGEMIVGDKKNTVFEGDVVYIPANNLHHAANRTDAPFHCVGVLLARPEELDKEAKGEEDVLGRLDARTAISHMLHVLAFAADARRKLEGEKGAKKADVERHTQAMEEAVMKAVERILEQYQGR
jgi:quercetin dioxygenase-like cupin family protein